MGGAYLSRPITQKVSEVGSNSKLSFGVSSMQGWRVKQEDAHICMLDFDEDTSLFGVYDGHGGFEVAKYTSERFPDYLRNNEKYKAQKYEAALTEAFLGFDDTIPTPEVLAVLKEMVKADNEGESECEESSELVFVGGSSQAGCSNRKEEYDEDNPESLRADANKPIEEVMASYRVPTIDKLKHETSKPASPYLRGRRGLSNGSSAGAACASAAGSSSNGGSSTADAATEHKTVSNEEESDISNSRVIPTEKCSEEPVSEGSSEAGGNNSQAVVNGTVNGGSSEDVENDGKRSKRTSAGSASSGNTTPSGTPGTSPKKTKKLALDDLDDSVAVKNFITNDEIAEDDEDDSEDETFQPTDESLDSGDDDMDEEDFQQLSKRTIAKHFLRAFATQTGRVFDDDEDDDDDDDDDDESDDDSTDEDNEDSSAQSEDVANEAAAGESGEEREDSGEESAEDSDEDDDEEAEEGMACGMMSEMGEEKPGIDSGCTAVVALLKGRDLYVANAGDSRCIICKAGKAVDMSEDHKPEDEAERARITKAGGSVTLDGRVNGGLNLSRAIGDHCYKKNTDLPNTEQMITALPDVRVIKLEPDVEFLVLACDGIWNSMNSQEVVNFVRPMIQKNEDLSKICEELFDKCLAPNTWGDGTGCDNMTCIIVKPSLGDDDTPPVEPNTTEKLGVDTKEIGAAGDATSCARDKSENSVSESVIENGVIQTDDSGDAANKVEQPSSGGSSTTATITSQSKTPKRFSTEMVADDGHTKRQKTDDTNAELS